MFLKEAWGNECIYVCVCVCCVSVCQGMSNQLTQLATRENHYDNMVRMYSNCEVVLDNLEVTYTLNHQNLSFLQVGGAVGADRHRGVSFIPLVFSPSRKWAATCWWP